MRRSLALIIILLVIIVGGVGYAYKYRAPERWAQQVPTYLHDNIGKFLVVDKAEFTRNPPELILTGVHLKNPVQLGSGDASTIGQINIVFGDYSLDPLHIESVTVQNVTGKYVSRGNIDNFSAVHQALMDRKAQTPRDALATKAEFKKLVIHNISVANADGSKMYKIPDSDLTPAKALANQPSLQNIIIDVLGTVIEQQQSGNTDLTVGDAAQKAVEKTKEALKSVGDAINNYLSKP